MVTSSLAWSCVNLISKAPSGNGVDFAIAFSMVEDVAALLLSARNSQTAYCMTNVDNAEVSRRNCAVHTPLHSLS